MFKVFSRKIACTADRNDCKQLSRGLRSIAVNFRLVLPARSNAAALKPKHAVTKQPVLSQWCSYSVRHKDASLLGRAPLDSGIGAVNSGSLRPDNLWPVIRKSQQYYHLIVTLPAFWCDAVRPIKIGNRTAKDKKMKYENLDGAHVALHSHSLRELP